MANLTTVDEVKSQGGITSLSSDDRLSALVTSTSDFIARYTGLDFGTAASFVDQFTGDGSQLYVPQHSPLASVTSLVVAGTPIDPSADPATDAGWYIADRAVRLRYYTFTDDALVVLTYTAGATAPTPLVQACIDLVLMAYKETPHIGTQSQSIAGSSMTFLPSLLPRRIQMVLDLYKRPSF